MRTITHIFVHCTANCPAVHPSQQVNIVRNEFKRKGWKRPGYHYLISTDGKLTELLSTSFIAYGVAGHNRNSVHVAYFGGLRSNGCPADTRTWQQKITLRDLLTVLKVQFPDAVILGHRDISPDKNGDGIIQASERIKECPCFDAMDEYADINAAKLTK